MANLLRSAKSGSDWGENELYVFNIGIANEDTYEFFGHPLPDQLDVSPVILSNIDEPPDATKADIDFFAYLEDAIAVPPDEESFVDDFASIVLKLMGYDSGRRIIHQQKELSFEMCGQRVSAKTDVCVMECGGAARYLLLVQKDKEHDRHLSSVNPEPQLVAEAFYQNNKGRERIGLATIAHAVIPGITMIGRAPTFFKIPVSEALVKAIVTGQYPAFAMTVQRLVPPVPDRLNYMIQGMKPLENRRVVFQCFQAFKALVYQLAGSVACYQPAGV
ncbi:uncharacterized protein EI90DRAFT_3254488 [Cantharellus anzutake]|uniref:uncharacterized protein n=1 Tax=Cantharellus anzutake TaxID=1750568 RepID=UPI001902C3BC|nr:uncharacterized protein EI90DRAFT_3254488 [Cantharellus anzutake]KAF8319561.1 hypothetical protein EI90DRAFT_3254488 [Cantharellus anzutake]